MNTIEKIVVHTHNITEEFFEAKCSSFNPKIFQGLNFTRRRPSPKPILENTFYCSRNFDSTILHD